MQILHVQLLPFQLLIPFLNFAFLHTIILHFCIPFCIVAAYTLRAYISVQEIAENQSLIDTRDQGVMRGPHSKGRTSYVKKPFTTADAFLSNEMYQRQVKRCLLKDFATFVFAQDMS